GIFPVSSHPTPTCHSLLTTYSVIHYLFFNCLRYLAPFILLVPQLWFKAGIPNGVLDGFVSEAMRSSGSTNNIFFNHDASKIIGTGVQANLRSLFANS